MEKVKSPFTKEQVEALQEWQTGEYYNPVLKMNLPYGHPFTCCSYDGCKRSEHNDGVLIPTEEGWVCPCGKYKQDWAHSFMAQKR